MSINIAGKRLRSPLNVLLAVWLAVAGILAGLLPASQAAAAEEPGPVFVMEDFEDGLDGQVRFDLRRSFSGSMSLESDPQYVRNGNHSVRLDYDFIGVKENPSYVFVGPPVYTIPIPGMPKKVGMWLYGNNDGHEIYSKFRDGANKSFEVEYLDPATGVDWNGWKYIEAPMPQDKPGPWVMEIYMRIEQSDFNKKNRGTVWVDDVRFIYDDNYNEDTQIPSLQVVSPASGETVTTDRPEILLSAADEQSGIEPSSVRMKLDGVPVEAAYQADSGIVAYTPERLAGGYHSVQASVYDGAGNPAQTNWSFSIEGGPQYRLEAPHDVMSNKTFPLQLQVLNPQSVNGAYAKLKFDPNVLEIVGTDSELAENRITTSDIDNVNGTFEFRADQLSVDAASAGRTLVTLNFSVKPSARMERGEAVKSIAMTAGSLRKSGGSELQASAEPHSYAIDFPYALDVQGISLHTPTTIRVTDDTGAPVQGAAIALPDIFGPQGFVVVGGAEASVYEKDKTSSAVLATVHAGDKLLVGEEASSADFYVVYLPDGSAMGYMPKASASAAGFHSLSEALGTTDAQGVIRTTDLTLALTKVQLQAVKGDLISEAIEIGIVPQLGTDEPQYVNAYVTEAPKTSLSIVWQTAPRVEHTFIQYAKDETFAGFDQAGVIELAVDSRLMLAPKNVGEIRYHQALLTELQPGTAYRYRVGYEGHWSEEHVLNTEPDKNEPFSFLFVTDSHTNSESGRDIYKDLMNNAFTTVPDTRFVMHGGDIVDDGGVMEEWTNFLMATEPYSGDIPSGYTIGNHDVKNGGKLVYQNVFGLPDNGVEGQKRLTYSFDYGDAHFVVLNSEADEIDMVKQAEWLRADLQASNKKWKLAMFHRTPYHTEFGRGPESVTRHLAPVLEELGVDLVLVGHDHALAWTYPMKGGKPQTNGGAGTVYLVGGASGWKFYDAYKYDYLDFLYDENVPVYSSVQVSGDKLTIQARTNTGELVGEREVVKKVVTETPPTGGTPVLPGKETGKGTTLDAKQLQQLVESGTTELELDEAGDTVNLPINAAELLGGKTLTLRFGSDSVTLTKELLEAAAASGEWKSIRVIVGKKQVAGKEDGSGVQIQAAATYKAAGEAVSVAVGGVDAKGEWKQLQTEAPVTLALAVSADADAGLVGLYAVEAEDGSVKYVRANTDGGVYRATVDGNGNYALLEYRVSYTDVPDDHWAHRIIAELSAQHLAEGVDEAKFAPDIRVTRAEFVAMLVRKLGLEATASSGFSDVAESAWYADAVAAARQAKLVEGTDTGEFMPDAYITREQLAAMVVRAHESVNGTVMPPEAGVSFADAEAVSDWAAEAVRKAKRLALIDGYEDGEFKPQGQATRAQSAKLIYLLDV